MAKKFQIRWLAMGFLAAALAPLAEAQKIEYYVHFTNGRVLRVDNHYKEGEWTFLVLNVRNQFAVPSESIKRVERVPLIDGKPVAATQANVGVQAGPGGSRAMPQRSGYRGRGAGGKGVYNPPTSKAPHQREPIDGMRTGGKGPGAGIQVGGAVPNKGGNVKPRAPRGGRPRPGYSPQPRRP